MFLVHFILIILLICPLFKTTPIVGFIKRNQLRPLLLMSGVIVTEEHVLTLEHPLVVYPKEDLLVLTGPQDYRYLSNNTLKYYGYGIKKIYIPKSSYKKVPQESLNLAIVQTHSPIRFYLRVNRAIILMRNMLQLTKCHFVYNVRKAAVGGYKVFSLHKFTPENLKLEFKRGVLDAGFTIYGTAHEDMKVCNFDCGAPVFCRHAVIGLLAFPLARSDCSDNCLKESDKGFTHCKVISAHEKFYLKFINIYNDEARELLDSVRNPNQYT